MDYEYEDDFYEDDEYEDNYNYNYDYDDYEDSFYIDDILDIYHYCKDTFIEENAVECIDKFISDSSFKYMSVTGDKIVDFSNNFDITFRYSDTEVDNLFREDFSDSILDAINDIYGEYHLDPSRWQPTVKEGLLTRIFIDGVIEKYKDYNEMLTPQANIYKYLGDYLNDVKDKYIINNNTLDIYNSICNYLDYCKDNYTEYKQLTEIENQNYNFIKYCIDLSGWDLSKIDSKNIDTFNKLKEKIENSEEYVM